MAPPLPPNRPSLNLLNIKDGDTVHQRFLLVYGTTSSSSDSNIVASCHDFPGTHWPCAETYFKVLVHLVPGPNTITLTASATGATLSFHTYYLPLLQNPPLHLVIFVAKDSPLVFDTPPSKSHENGLNVAKEKLRLAGYLWQSFCAEQMYRHGQGRRTFRLEEAWLPDTVTRSSPKQRQTAVVRVIRSQHDVRTIRDARRAQQNPDRKDTIPSLFDLFMQDLESHFEQQPCLVAGIILDSHWDPQQKLVLGHAALGGGAGEARLGLFGSHALHAFPRSIEDLVPAMMDNTPTDTRYVANDANESGSWWKALNIGMGAMLHEIGHMFTLSHTPTGLMARGFNHWNRTFMIREPGRQGVITQNDEAGSKWHRVDIVRLRYHPAFRLPLDPIIPSCSGGGASFMPLGPAQLQVTSPSGITMIELWLNGRYATHYEYMEQGPVLPTQLAFSIEEDFVRKCRFAGVRYDPHKDSLKLEVTSPTQQTEILENVHQFLVDSVVRLPGLTKPVFKGKGLGNQDLGGGGDAIKYLSYAVVVAATAVDKKMLRAVRVYSGSFMDGIEFIYADGTTDIVGKRGGHANEVWQMIPGEVLTGISVRCGAWVDGLCLLTNIRQSPWYGGHGGGLVTALAPKNHQLIGLYASSGDWMDQIGIYYT